MFKTSAVRQMFTCSLNEEYNMKHNHRDLCPSFVYTLNFHQHTTAIELHQDLGVHIKICLYKFIFDIYQQDMENHMN
jgi:hypothetical protein